MSEDNKAKMRQFYEEVVQNGNFTMLDELKRFSNRPCTTWGGRGYFCAYRCRRTDACLFDGSARAGAPRTAMPG